MDCFAHRRYYCDRYRSKKLETSESIPKQYENEERVFLVRVEVERAYPSIDDSDCDEANNIRLLLEGGATHRDYYTFWRPRLDKNVISQMLTEVGIPSQRQGFMVDGISDKADRMAKEDFSGTEGACKILQMKVFISIVSSCCVFIELL